MLEKNGEGKTTQNFFFVPPFSTRTHISSPATGSAALQGRWCESWACGSQRAMVLPSHWGIWAFLYDKWLSPRSCLLAVVFKHDCTFDVAESHSRLTLFFPWWEAKDQCGGFPSNTPPCFWPDLYAYIYPIIYVTLPTYLWSDTFSNDTKYCNELRINHKPTFNHVASVGLFTYLKPNLLYLNSDVAKQTEAMRK